MNYRSPLPRGKSLLTACMVLLLSMKMFTVTSFGEMSNVQKVESLENTPDRLDRKSLEFPTKRALLVGVSQYRWAKPPTFPELRGSHNDVVAMRELLIGRFGFDPQNIRILKGDEATRKSILNSFREFLIKRTKPNDIVMFYFSGHGSTVVDTNGDEADGYDETLVPYDGRDPEGNIPDIRDDEIHNLLVELSQKQAYPILILDSCHSGSGARIPNLLTERKIPPDTRTSQRMRPQGGLKNSDGEKGRGFIGDLGPYIALTASGDSQSSFEIKWQGKFVGAFSYTLQEVLRNLSPNATYRELMTKVRTRIKRYHVTQLPQFEGNILGKVFRTGATQETNVISVERITGKKVILGAGAIHGMTEGSEFEVYPLGHADKEKSKAAIATVSVKQVHQYESSAEVIEGRIPQELKEAEAIETAHIYGDLGLLIVYDSSDQLLQTIIPPLVSSRLVQVAVPGKRYDIRIYTNDREVILEHLDKTIVSRVRKNEKDLGTTISERIKKLSRYKLILNLNNERSPLDLNVEIERSEAGLPENWRRLNSPPDWKSGDVVVHPGEHVRFVITNTSDSNRSAYVYAFYLGPDYSVVPFYPARGAEDNLLPAGQAVYTPSGRVERGAKNRRNREVIMVMATSEPVPLWNLEQQGVSRDLIRSPLESLLREAMTGTRGTSDKPVPLNDWSTHFLGVLVTDSSGDESSAKPSTQDSGL